jgi:hypothetical protein
MSQKDYVSMASMLHECYKRCEHVDGAWTIVYDTIYTPYVLAAEAENPRFDMTRFSWAVATGDMNITNCELPASL